jgi:hypothetical protein
MKRGLFFVLCCSFFNSLFAQNLVVNPGLENWNKINKPTGWNIAVNCLKDSSSVRSGTYSCKHFAPVSDTKNLGQTITVVPGKQYRLSFKYKTEVIGEEHGCRIWCSWKDATPTDITDAAAKLILQPSTYMKSDIWQQFSVDVIAPENAKYFYLEVRTYQNSNAYYDDFVFEESFPTIYNEIQSSEIKVYPNPAREYLNISNLNNLQHIDIQNITGTPVLSYTFPGVQNAVIPVSGLREGVYVIRIQTSERIITRKIIIE